MKLTHIDGRPGPFAAGDHVVAEGVRCHGLVIAVCGAVPTVLWTRSSGSTFICSDDTLRLQELVDIDHAVIADEDFYISDTINITKSITLDSCRITMMGSKDKVILNLAKVGQLTVIRSNYLRQGDYD